MTNKNITDLVAATVTSLSDLLLGRIGADTEDKKIPVSVLATLLRTTGLYGTSGQGLSIKEGTNARMGTATLVAGTVTVANTSITANTRIFCFIDSGTQTNAGFLRVSARVASTSFTITSSNASDTSGVSWLLIEPAP